MPIGAAGAPRGGRTAPSGALAADPRGRGRRAGRAGRRRRPARRAPATTGIATGSRSSGPASGATGSSRSAIGRRVVESGHAGPRADERRLEDPRVGAPPGDDDVVGAGRARPARSTIGADDRVGRDRARQARQDPGERLGFLAPPTSRPRHAWRWRIAANPTTMTRPTTAQSIGRARSVASRRTAIRPRMKKEPAKIHQARRRPTFRRLGGSCWRAGGLAHVRYRGWRSGRVTSIPATGTDGGRRPVPSYRTRSVRRPCSPPRRRRGRRRA